MKYLFNQVGRFSIALLFLISLTGGSLGQKVASGGVKTSNAQSALAASVTPVFFEGVPGNPDSGNPNCSTLNALHVNGAGDVRFSHIITNDELKLDFATPNGTFPYTTGNGRFVTGQQYANQSVTVSSSGSTVNSWSSTLQVTAVILKIGNDAYVYPYKPFSNGDTNLAAGAQQSISHLTFCYGQPTGTTAGDASITGRVVDARGNGVAKAQMVLVNGSTGETKITMTSPFGYYTFAGLDVNELYVVNVSHKRFSFAERQRTVVLLDNALGMDFVADPPQ